MKTTVPFEIPVEVILIHIKTISKRALSYLEGIGGGERTMVGGDVDANAVKAVSGIVCLVTLAGYAWAKGWGRGGYETQKSVRKKEIGNNVPFPQNANNADTADASGLSLLNDRLWELTGNSL